MTSTVAVVDYPSSRPCHVSGVHISGNQIYLVETRIDIDLSAADRAFAADVRAFVATTLDRVTRGRVLLFQLPGRAERPVWQRAPVARGWGAPAWPVERGGPGWTVTQRYVFDEIMAEQGAPTPPVFGMGMLAPVLMRFGSPTQKTHYLPRILNVEDWWCQGFSEPNAGSDLAGLKTGAVRDGDDWVIDGQKIWTTLAHQADSMFCLVRTSQEEKKQAGLSLLLVPMATPGITVRPIITIDGEHEVNEVFLDAVRVRRQYDRRAWPGLDPRQVSAVAGAHRHRAGKPVNPRDRATEVAWPIDLEAVARTIATISALIVAHPEIGEIDVNPLVAYPAGTPRVALDVLIVLA